MQERQPIRILVGPQRRFVHQPPNGEVRQEEAPELLPDQLRGLAAQHDPRPPQVCLAYPERPRSPTARGRAPPVAGERDPDQLAAYRDPHCKAPIASLRAALVGNDREEHVFALGQTLELYDVYQAKVAADRGGYAARGGCRPLSRAAARIASPEMFPNVEPLP